MITRLIRAVALVALIVPFAAQAEDKPNILVIWGDDIGGFNISAYNQGMMAIKRPISTASPGKARCSRTGTPSRAAPPDAPRSSPASRPSVPA
jgi:hypothetical protein